MARNKIANNPYRYIIFEDEECVEFETIGKNKYKVIVDKNAWEKYLSHYSWTAIKRNTRIDVKTSINKHSNRIWRVIIEHEYNELDYWGTTIDHKNNNPLDNRLSNLRIFNTAILNCTNISSKYGDNDMQFIHRQGPKEKPNGYKVHYNLAGRTFYKNFGFIEYGSESGAIEAAKKYRDEIVYAERQKVINEMIKKTRNVEFERGLRVWRLLQLEMRKKKLRLTLRLKILP